MTSETPKPESVEPLTDEQKTALIAGAQSFAELYFVIDQIGTINGSRNKPYPAEKLKAAIQEVEELQILPKTVTRTFGLRDKVYELMEKKLRS